METPDSPKRLIVAQLLSCVRLFVTPRTAACQVSLSFTISLSLLKLMSIESMIPSNHLILCHPFLLPSIFISIRVFSNESALRIRWPKYWSFSFNISPSNEFSGLISFSTDWFDHSIHGLLLQQPQETNSFQTLSRQFTVGNSLHSLSPWDCNRA